MTRKIFRLPFYVAVLSVSVLHGLAGAQNPSNSPASVPDFSGALHWRLIGPFRGGRVVAVSGVPGEPTFYSGSVGGGVWKSPNAGVTWQPIFDGQPIASIGALAVSPSSPNLIYAGTGESDIRSDLSSGDGVYKSLDGGKTWTNIGLRETRQISRIVVDPNNPDVVYVAALGHAYGPNPERGVYKSGDGGKTWTQVLNKGAEIGASDLSIAAGHPNVLFAGMWNAHRPPWSTYAPLAGKGSGLYRSTDAGATWTQISGHGLPDGDWGRVGIALAPDAKRVYALIDAAKNSGLYRSDNGGDTWALANADPRLTSRAWYFNWLTIDPSNPDVVYVPNVALYRVSDAGKTLAIVRGAPGGDDYHDVWVDPKNSAHLILGSDQGASVSLDGGKTWSSWYNQPTGQFYHVTTDNRFPYAVYGAQQDSGAAGIYSRTDHGLIGPRDWFSASGSESGYIVVDKNDPNILYVSGVFGGLVRFDRRTSLSQNIEPWPMPGWGSEINGRKYRAPWTPVLVQSPLENALLLGTQYVMKTTDGGLHWQQISPDLTGTSPQSSEAAKADPISVANAMQRGYGVVYTIAPSRLNKDVIWAGSDTGLVHLTRDGGKTWQNVTPSGLSPWSKITLIEASHFDPAMAYAAIDRHRLDDQRPYLFRTRDYGQSWHPITGGIGDNAFLNAVREDPQKQGLLFAGTELGVYVSFDDGDHWRPLQFNLPVASIRDIAVHGDDLIIATHGRAFWILNNITPLRQADGNGQFAAGLLKPATAVRVDNDRFLGTPLPPDEPTAPNPPDGAMLDYYLNRPAKQVVLEVFDRNSGLVRRINSGELPPKHPPLPIAEHWIPVPSQLSGTLGMHRYLFDLRWGAAGESDGDDGDMAFGAPAGPRLAPGTYQLKLTLDGTSYTQPLTITMDPRSPATEAELERQQNLSLEIYRELRKLMQTRKEIGSASKRVQELNSELLPGHPDLAVQLKEIEPLIERILKGTPGPPGSISGLDAAASGLTAALRVVDGGDRQAPAQAMEVYQQASRAADAGIAEWQELKNGALLRLNTALQRSGLHPIETKAPQQEGAQVLADE